jgi:hypothetical protein
MKRVVLFTLLALAVPLAARADSIITGTLDFHCVGCAPQGETVDTVPTDGAFSYNNSDKQFLSFNFNWNGMAFFLYSSPERNDRVTYLDLIGKGSSPLLWVAICSAGQEPPFGMCGGQFVFAIYDSTSNFMIPVTVLATTPEFPYDAAAGTITAMNLHDPVTTLEPSVLILVIVALFIGGSILGWKWAIDPKSRNHGKFHPRTLHRGTMRRPAPMH